MLHPCSRWFLYANCSTSNTNITMSWQISIDPIFKSEATGAGHRLGRKLLHGVEPRFGEPGPSMQSLMVSDEISLGRTVVPALMKYKMMKADVSKTAPKMNSSDAATSVSSTTSVDITHFLGARGVAGLNPAPLDPNDLAKGPSNFPFKSAQIGARCQEYYSGAPLQCQCQTQVSWVVAEQGAFVTYKGPVP